MGIQFEQIIRKSYKVIAALLAITLFFLFYNSFLVDRSLISLNIALNSVANAQTTEDLRKIQSLIKAPLFNEISKKTPSAEVVIALGVVNSMLESQNALQQKSDIAFYLQGVIRKQEGGKNKAVIAVNKFNSAISSRRTLSPKKLENKGAVNSIIRKINLTADSRDKQVLYFDLGNLYLKTQNFAKARDTFILAINESSDTNISWNAKFNLALSFRNLGNLEEAFSLFEEVGEYRGDLKLAVTSQYEAAGVLYSLKRYIEARDRYANLAKENPQFESSALALYRAGTISMYELNDFKSALKFFYELGMSRAGYISFLDLNDIETALKYFEELENNISRKNPMSVHIKRDIRKVMASGLRLEGYKLIKDKKYSEAVLIFQKALVVDSSDSVSMIGEALALYWMGLKEKAYSKAIDAIGVSDPMSEDITVTNAMFICSNTGNPEKAVEIGEKFLNKRTKSVSRPEFYYNLGYAYVSANKIDGAITNLNRAIRLDEDFVFSYNNLGCAFWSKKEYAQATQMFQRAISLYPSYADAYYNLGVVYFQLGRFEEAYSQFELALDSNPAYKDAKWYLSKIEKDLKYNPLEISSAKGQPKTAKEESSPSAQ